MIIRGNRLTAPFPIGPSLPSMRPRMIIRGNGVELDRLAQLVFPSMRPRMIIRGNGGAAMCLRSFLGLQ